MNQFPKPALIAGCIGALSLNSTCALADWPTDPQTPLIIGESQGFFGPRLSIVEANDDGVWVAWQDSFCVGSLRLQRVGLDGSLLTPIGLDIQEDPSCGAIAPPMLVPNGQGVVVSRVPSSVSDDPIQRISDDGSLLWKTGFSVATPVGLALAGSTELVGGDVLIVSYRSDGIYLDRVDAVGERVWEKQSHLLPSSGSVRIFGIVPEPTGGAYIFWDSFLAYTKLIYAMRVGADGDPVWEAPVRLVEPPPGIASSRHSDPVAVSDGAGGAVVVWTHGFETGWTPAPQRFQRIAPDGTLGFDIEGARVSLGTNRQFFVNVQTDPITNDLFIVWRDGLLEEMTLNAQRMTVEGDRLWGDLGVVVAPIDFTLGSFDALWHNNQLSMAIGDPTGAVIHNLDAQGQPASGPWIVGDGAHAGDVRMAKSGDGIVVAWQGDGPLNDDFVAAQRVNPDGRLGGPPCSPADLNNDGELNFFDVSAFLSAIANGDLIADFTGDGELNFFDVSAFLTLFGSGCP